MRDQLHGDPLHLIDRELLLRQRLQHAVDAGPHVVAGLDVDVAGAPLDGGLEQFLHVGSPRREAGKDLAFRPENSDPGPGLRFS